MLLFCPVCGNLLTISRAPTTSESTTNAGTAAVVEAAKPQGQNRFECRTCPYQHILDQGYYELKKFPGKKAEDVISAESWSHYDKTEIACPEEGCDSREAYFYQMQIRGGDEPMTTFYRCVKCQRDFRSD